MADTTKLTVQPPLDKVRRDVDDRRKQLADFRTPYARSAVFLDQWVQRNFRTEGGKVGGWKPFSPVTLAQIAQSDPGRQPAKLLQRTGRLRSSFLPFAENRDAGIGSNLYYAKPHHEGKGRLPKRQMLPTRELVAKDIRRIFVTHVQDSVK